MIGGNLLTDSLVMDVDRDRGVVTLSVAGHEPNPLPAGAVRVEGHHDHERLFVPADIDGKSVKLAVDLSAPRTAVWESVQAGLTPLVPPEEHRFVDETGGEVYVESVRTIARTMTLGGTLQAHDVKLGTFADQRHYEITFDGVLGENVLARYHTLVDLDRARVWLGPRDADLGTRLDERIHRWGETFAGCASAGCASLGRQADGFTIARDPGVPLPRYQVVVQGLDDHGAPIAAPPCGSPSTPRR